MVGKATPDRGGPRKTPDGVDPSNRRTRKTQCDGHNSGVKIWSLCSVSSTLSHANLQQPFSNLTNQVRGKILLKKSSCVFLHASFIPASFLLASVIIASVCIHYIYVYFCMNQQMSIQHEDMGCCPEDLPGAMNDREEWRERVRDIRATSATWWWWYIYIYIYKCSIIDIEPYLIILLHLVLY